MHWRLQKVLDNCPQGPDPDEVWAWCETAEQEIPLACGDLNHSYPIFEPVRQQMAHGGGTPPPEHHAELTRTVLPRIKAAVVAAGRAMNPAGKSPDS